jgi:hypothetical protein
MRHNTMHENGTPANRRRLAALSTTLAVVLVVVVVAVTVVGPVRTIDWLVNDLTPVVVVTGVVIASVALLGWALKRLPESPLRDWYQ